MTGRRPAWALPVALIATCTALVLASLVFAREKPPNVEPGPAGIRKVVVFTVPGLALEDVSGGTMPAFDALTRRGAIAVMHVRTRADAPDAAAGYASLGAGNWIGAPDAERLVIDGDAALGSTTAGSLLADALGVDPVGELVLPEAPALLDELRPTGGSAPGALVDALRASGHATALISSGGGGETSRAPGVATDAALAAFGSDGSIDTGTLGWPLVRRLVGDDGEPATWSDPDAHVSAVADALELADVVVVDPGDTSRATERTAMEEERRRAEEEAAGAVEPTEPDPAADAGFDADAFRREALEATDRVLGSVARSLDDDTLLVVTGITPPGEGWRWTPAVVVGSGIPRGYLVSPSTQRNRPALVTLTDLAPTVLDVLDVEVPGEMIGQPLRYQSEPRSNWEQAENLEDLLDRRESAVRLMTLTFAAVQIGLYAACLLLLLRGAFTGRLRDWASFLALACAAWPLGTFLLRLVPSLYGYGAGTLALSWAAAGAIAALALRWRRHPLDPLLLVCGATVATLVIDLVAGGRLQVASFFGYSPYLATRYVGVNNHTFALLASSTVVVMVGLVARAADVRAAWWTAATVAAVVVFVDGAPWVGADVGGILAMVPVFALTLWLLRGGRIEARSVLAAVALGVVVLGFAVGVEALRDPSQRTHVGRFFLGSDDAGIADTLARKWGDTTRSLGRWPLLWLVPIGAALGAHLLRTSAFLRRALPDGSPERLGAYAILAIGTLGWLVNDSGPAVLALACIYLGPLILLLDRARRPDREPVPGADEDVPGASAEDRRHVERGLTSPLPAAPQVVALVPAKERADSVGATVRSLAALDAVQRVVVIDDGSEDRTAAAAAEAGAEVLRLSRNVGKAGAIRAGVEATPDADVYLLIDADLASTAAAADLLLEPVLADRADLVVGVLPPAGGRGGFGAIKRLAAAGVRRACAEDQRAPLSGQRAMRASVLRDLEPVARFGLEVALTIDAARAGARIIEVEVPMDHRHTGRSLSGFRHRGRQGIDIVEALWPRLVSRRAEAAGLVALTGLVLAGAVTFGSNRIPSSVPLGAEADRVLLFGMAPLAFDDISPETTPNLARLFDEGAAGAMSIRTVARQPNVTEGYLTVGAGYRLQAPRQAGAIVPSDLVQGSSTAADHLEAVTGTRPVGPMVAIEGPAIDRANQGLEVVSRPGHLGDRLRSAGMSSAAVGSADQPVSFPCLPMRSSCPSEVLRPAGLAMMTSDFGVPDGAIEGLLVDDPTAPFGVRADPDALLAETSGALDRAEVVLVDPGDLSRADAFRQQALGPAADAQWDAALARTDALLGEIVADLDDRTMVVVVAMAPPDRQLTLTPVVAWGAGTERGTLQSPATRRHTLVTITDLAPTVLQALGVAPGTGFVGSPMRVQPGAPDRPAMEVLAADTEVRERTYYGQSHLFIVAHGMLAALALVVIALKERLTGAHPALRWALLSLISYPMATFLVRLVPGLTDRWLLAQVGAALALSLVVGALCVRRRTRHPLAPLQWVTGLTAAVIVVDTWLGTPMQASSWLGSSLHNAGRFYGIPNSTFAVLGACSLLWGALAVHRSARPDRTLVLVGCAWVTCMLSAGLPQLGADVGSLLTLAPVYGLVLWRLSGRPLRWRSVLLAGVAVVVLVGGAALLDWSRPEEARSHLGRFADQLLDDGPGSLWDTIARKQAANIRILQRSVWANLLPIVAGFFAVLLLWLRRGQPLLARGSTLWVGAASVVGAAVLGYATNDSGPIVVALFVSYLPALATFVAIDGTGDVAIELVEAPEPDRAEPVP